MHRRVRRWVLPLLMLVVLVFPWTANAHSRSILYWGMTGPDVTLVQQRLSAWGYYNSVIDGDYGPNTYDAITWFQSANGLTPDGVVGPATWAALGEYMAPETAPQPAGTGITRSDDLDLLARVVTAEAKGEPYEGQVAVAAVILNRMRDARFPATLAGVVYETWAFESVSNGTIWGPVSPTAIQAARDALNGWDPTGGAVFFWNPGKVVSNWVWSRPIVLQIGNHVFAK